MKRFFAIIPLLAAFAAVAQYMPVKEGQVLKFDVMERADVKADFEKGTATVTVTSVETSDDGSSMTATVKEHKSISSEKSPEDTNSTYTFSPETKLTTYVMMTAEDFKATVMNVMREMAEQAGQYVSPQDMEEMSKMLKPKGNLEIPLTEAPEAEASFPTSSIRMSLPGQSAGVKAAKGKYLGMEELETSAGKFNCLKLTYVLAPIGQGVDNYVTEWYATNLGLVKQVVADKKGNTLFEQTLTSFSE